ncbi:hypothetical protein RHSIM_Rhsim12G0022500 [Rhododendron simsii]|uniref:Protein kinase domain-containing protein n=1 Tax=Rhododendron simsii TaxID=118357 RepID=A0A834L8Q1_RHOSS|nr:hypothetical protein RHSIM_Rhsim12G0022500 [Rhododendron simsii]
MALPLSLAELVNDVDDDGIIDRFVLLRLIDRLARSQLSPVSVSQLRVRSTADLSTDCHCHFQSSPPPLNFITFAVDSSTVFGTEKGKLCPFVFGQELKNERKKMSFYILLQNSLFTSKDEHSPLKAIDFGLSDYVKPDERLNDIVGSAYYVAPEVLHRSYGPQADMWSIGAIAYILLCHPWLANYHDVKIPLDMIIYKLGKAYICLSSLRKAALGWHGRTNAVCKCNAMELKENKPFSQTVVALAKSLTVPQLAYLRGQFTLLGPNKSGYISLQNFKTAVAKNSTEAMKDSRVLDYADMMSTLQYRKLDFEEFCAAAISVHQLEGMESWEQHARSAYELFEKDGNRPTMMEELASLCSFFPLFYTARKEPLLNAGVQLEKSFELRHSPSVPVHVVLQDWIRQAEGKLSFLRFVRLLHGVSSRLFQKA